MNDTCFVIMPVGTQSIGNISLLKKQFRKNMITSSDNSLSDEEQQQILFKEFGKNPEDAKNINKKLLKSGIIKV